MLLFVASWQSRHLSVKKTKNQKKIPLELVSDQTNVRLNPPLIGPFPSWIDFWSYHPQTKVTSDHTIPKPKWPLIIPSPDRSDLWSYHPQTEVTSDHTIPRPKWPLIIPSPDRSDLWSYHPQTEVTSDHTIPRPKWPLIIPSPDRSDLWSYYCALEPNPRPCNFGLGTHCVRCTWSDQRSLPDGTSTWVDMSAICLSETIRRLVKAMLSIFKPC